MQQLNENILQLLEQLAIEVWEFYIHDSYDTEIDTKWSLSEFVKFPNCSFDYQKN